MKTATSASGQRTNRVRWKTGSETVVHHPAITGRPLPRGPARPSPPGSLAKNRELSTVRTRSGNRDPSQNESSRSWP
jgi:hypothetical protein